jgi:glycosyltransferase involved in cell wall biosynthesis
MDKVITILIVNFNTSRFIKLSLWGLKKLTKNKYEVYILDNGSSYDDYIKLKKICSSYPNVILEKNETELRGSIAHATALDHMVKKVKTEYFSILDADAIWLRKNWDSILIEKLTDKIKVIGTQAPNGTTKFQDFPLMFSILFETATFNSLSISFLPKDIKLGLDTGFELREKYLNAEFSGMIIEMKNTRIYKNGPFKNCICAEYYFDNDYDNIFAAHFGRGSTKQVDRFNNSLWYYKIPILSRKMIEHNWKLERLKWIFICKKIIYFESITLLRKII